METEFEDKMYAEEVWVAIKGGLSRNREGGWKMVEVMDLFQYTSIAQYRMPASKVDAIVYNDHAQYE